VSVIIYAHFQNSTQLRDTQYPGEQSFVISSTSRHFSRALNLLFDQESFTSFPEVKPLSSKVAPHV